MAKLSLRDLDLKGKRVFVPGGAGLQPRYWFQSMRTGL